MSDTKTTYIMPDQGSMGNNDLLTASLLNNGGFGGNGIWNNPFMYLIWMYMMRWLNGNGEWGNSNGNGALEAATQRQIQTLSD